MNKSTSPRSPKTYIVKWERNRMTESTERYTQGTLAQIARYCGSSRKTIAAVINEWNKELTRRYECTYTSVSVELVESVPEGARLHILQD